MFNTLYHSGWAVHPCPQVQYHGLWAWSQLPNWGAELEQLGLWVGGTWSGTYADQRENSFLLLVSGRESSTTQRWWVPPDQTDHFQQGYHTGEHLPRPTNLCATLGDDQNFNGAIGYVHVGPLYQGLRAQDRARGTSLRFWRHLR